MAGDLDTLLDGFQTVLSTISGLHAENGWPDNINSPCAIPRLVARRAETLDHQTTHAWTFDVLVLVQIGTLRAMQERLKPYVSATGASSIERVLLADGDLNGAADCINSVTLTTYDTVNANGVEFGAAIFRVEVLA